MLFCFLPGPETFILDKIIFIRFYVYVCLPVCIRFFISIMSKGSGLIEKKIGRIGYSFKRRVSGKIKINRFKNMEFTQNLIFCYYVSLARNERLCQICNCIEDEFHVLEECPIFNNERTGLLNKSLQQYPNVFNFYDYLNSENIEEQKKLGLLCLKIQIEYRKML